ncbi:LOB domain-containing protein 26, partial [Frankliniella fusca]
SKYVRHRGRGDSRVRREKPKIKEVTTKEMPKVRAHCSKDVAPVRQNNCPKKVPTGTAKKTVKPTTVVRNFKGKVQRDNFEMDGMATFIQSFINEPCKPADMTEKPHELPKCYVRLERLPASKIPKTTEAKGKPSVLRVKKTIKRQKAAKKVAAVKKLGFDVNNRAGVCRDLKILCPVDGNMSNNFNHINRHKTPFHGKMIRTNVQGFFSTNTRGPFYREDILNDIERHVAKGRDSLNSYITNLFHCAGVGLTDKLAEAMPIYKMQEIFKVDTDVKKSKKVEVDLQADLELETTSEESANEEESESEK